jgi:hypothetical protein
MFGNLSLARPKASLSNSPTPHRSAQIEINLADYMLTSQFFVEAVKTHRGIRGFFSLPSAPASPEIRAAVHDGVRLYFYNKPHGKIDCGHLANAPRVQ